MNDTFEFEQNIYISKDYHFNLDEIRSLRSLAFNLNIPDTFIDFINLRRRFMMAAGEDSVSN